MLKKRLLQICSILFFILIIGLSIVLVWNKNQALNIEQKNPETSNLHLTEFFEQLDNNTVRCGICPNRCTLVPGQTGICQTRKNVDGKLYSLVYGEVASAQVDPIEKKPLYHFLPGTMAYSIATAGCNMQCKFCQNWSISQQAPADVPSEKQTPEQVVAAALASGAKSIAYTYNEPTIFYEFMLDTAKLARAKGLKNIMHSNGYINEEPLLKLIPYLDAVNIDLKGIKDRYYLDYTTSGRVEPVLNTLKTLKQQGVWLEITNLIVPGGNDSNEDIKELVTWIKDNLGTSTPLHFSRFFPLYKLENLIPTPADTMLKAKKIAQDAGLKYIYVGNLETEDGGTTFCADGSAAIKRKGYFVEENNLKEGKCADGQTVPGVWQ